MRQLTGIAQRFFGDYINGSRNSRRAEQGGASPTHHFYTFNHAGRNLFQSIHSGKALEWTRIYQNLRIWSVQTIDTDLLEATILAICLHTHSGLEVQLCDKVEELVVSKSFRSTTFTKVGAMSTCRFTPIGGNYYSVESNRILFYFKIFFQCLSFFSELMLRVTVL